MNKKIVILGGTGMLGKSLKEIDNDLICIGSEKDIVSFKELEKELNEIKPDIIVNAAAIKSEHVIEDFNKAIDVNIIGSSNVAKYCIENDIRLVYISTDYIYSGKKGMYKENEEILPHNLYAWTKLGGECPVKLVRNHLIIRTSFGNEKFPYVSAHKNLYTSKDYVDVISKMILDVIDNEYVGVLNVGTDRKSMFEYASLRNVVGKSFLKESKDFSLNTDLYKKITSYFKYNESCPMTGDTDKIKYFDLGDMPIVNNLTDTFEESLTVKKYPLSVNLFRKSGLSMLDVVVDPTKMFENYTFRSSTNKPYYTHCKNMYKHLSSFIDLKNDDLCVDIGGNDGTLLMAFNEMEDELNLPECEKLNIDPSKNITEISIKNGIKTLVEYFNDSTYHKIEKKAKLIVSTNVFQHLYNIKSFVIGIRNLLENDGIWCLEFPYWANTMETNQFDQVYHEHIYYYMVNPINNFLNDNGLKIISITDHYIHGGSLRLVITKNDSSRLSDGTLDYYLKKEEKFDEKYYLNWAEEVEKHLSKCKDILDSLKGKNIVGFGAAAKGCIFLNKQKIDYNTIKYVIDDTELKQNKYIPGTGIKIVKRNIIKEREIDYILILAHNFSEYIIKSMRDYGYKGKFIVFFPVIKII